MRRNFHLSAVLRWEAKAAGDYEQAMGKLHLASHFDSLAIENFLSFLVLAVRSRRTEPLVAALALPVFTDFRSQVFLITNLIIVLFQAAFMAGFIYVAAKTIYYLPMLSHRIDLQPHNRFKGLIGLALLLLPVLAFRNFFLIFLSYAALLVFVLTARERNWLRFICLALIALFIVSLPLHNLIDFLQKRSRSYLLYEMVHYDSGVAFGSINDSERIFEAYAYKQRGELERAMSLYEAMYYEGHREIGIVNNLANIYLLYSADARAETLYNYAMRVGTHGEPFFNMWLLKLRNLEYSESSRYMAEARRRGYSSAISEPQDIAPSTSDCYRFFHSERISLFHSVNPVFLFSIIALLVLTFLPFRFSMPYYCETCGRAICHKCQDENTGEAVCQECFARLKSTENVEMETRLKHSVVKRHYCMRLFIAYLINVIVPGSGLIYIGKNFAGIAFVFIVMLAYAPLLFPSLLARPAGWVSLPLAPVFLVIAIAVGFIAYVSTFFTLRNYHGD
ncbi:hypothetical protein IBX73_07970 [candidate division WOR-3 bacterium]|nr:hypothetical protein [candidate division WOR-3 bacterium]